MDSSLSRLVFRTDLPPHVPIQSAPALLVGRTVEQHLRQVGNESDLKRIEHSRLAAAVITEQEATCADGQQFVLKVIPLHKSDGFKVSHEGVPCCGSVAPAWGSDSASV